MSQKLSNVGYNANITLQMIEATHGGLKEHTSVFVHKCYLYCRIMNRKFRKIILLLFNKQFMHYYQAKFEEIDHFTIIQCRYIDLVHYNFLLNTRSGH